MRGFVNLLTLDHLLLDCGFYDASQAGRVPDPLLTLTPAGLQALLTKSRSYRTAPHYCETLGFWRDILHQSRLFLAGNYDHFGEDVLKTWMDKVLDLRRREPLIPRVVETAKLVELVLLALCKSGFESHYPAWRALHFGTQQPCSDDSKRCALCWTEIPEGGARYQSAGDCSHQFHMACILPAIEIDDTREPCCPVCPYHTQLAERRQYGQFQLLPIRDPELRTLDQNILPPIAAPPFLLRPAPGLAQAPAVPPPGDRSRGPSRAPSRVPSVDDQDVMELHARGTPFSEGTEAMDVETPRALLRIQREQGLAALPGQLARDFPEAAEGRQDLIEPETRARFIRTFGEKAVRERIDLYKLLAVIPY